MEPTSDHDFASTETAASPGSAGRRRLAAMFVGSLLLIAIGVYAVLRSYGARGTDIINGSPEETGQIEALSADSSAHITQPKTEPYSQSSSKNSSTTESIPVSATENHSTITTVVDSQSSTPAALSVRPTAQPIALHVFAGGRTLRQGDRVAIADSDARSLGFSIDNPGNLGQVDEIRVEWWVDGDRKSFFNLSASDPGTYQPHAYDNLRPWTGEYDVRLLVNGQQRSSLRFALGGN